MIDVTFTVVVNNDAIHTNDLAWWQRSIALDTDTQVTTWPEVYAFVAQAYLAGGDYGSYVIRHAVNVERLNDPDIGTDVRASEAGAGPVDGTTAQVWATDTKGWPDEDD